MHFVHYILVCGADYESSIILTIYSTVFDDADGEYHGILPELIRNRSTNYRFCHFLSD